jgi:NAD-dependent deacetylase
VLTGAGISVASGLRPYRGKGGLWDEQPELEELATAEGLARDPHGVWRAFGPMRRIAKEAQPNAAHFALAKLEERVPLAILTQNVDGLHQRAGSKNVVELHGTLFETKCDRCGRVRPDDVPHETAPTCECGALERLKVVLFDEALDVDVERAARDAIRGCDLFVAIGTSGTVYPAANYARSAKFEGARTVLINLEAMLTKNPYFDEEILGPAETLLPSLI